jgi:hypothetical protein
MATFSVVVVLPTPPFWFVTAITLHLRIKKLLSHNQSFVGYVKGAGNKDID